MIQFDLIGILQMLVGTGSLVCFILVLVQMFQHGETGVGIACIVLLCLCGIGSLVAFVYGWLRADRWRIRNLMMVWTALWIAGIVLGAIRFPALPAWPSN